MTHGGLMHRCLHAGCTPPRTVRLAGPEFLRENAQENTLKITPHSFTGSEQVAEGVLRARIISCRSQAGPLSRRRGSYAEAASRVVRRFAGTDLLDDEYFHFSRSLILGELCDEDAERTILVYTCQSPLILRVSFCPCSSPVSSLCHHLTYFSLSLSPSSSQLPISPLRIP